MKKVIIAYDGVHFSEGAFAFARMLNEKSSILLAGVFLPLVNFSSLWSYASATAAAGTPVIPMVEEEDANAIQRNIQMFEELCRRHNIDSCVHRDYNDFAVPQLIKESRYADLVILGSESFYTEAAAQEPNAYLRDVLHLAECPLLVVPEKFVFPDSNILAYDGSDSSVYAIKQFAYLFPELTHNSTLLLYAGSHPATMPDATYIEELTAKHFPNLVLSTIELPSTHSFATWIGEKRSTILVTGAYGRSSFSQLFRKSFVSDVIRDHVLPVFITHR